MTTITSDGTLSYSGGTFYYNGSVIDFSSSITINADVTVTFGSNLTLTTTDQYFIINGSDVTIDGAGYEVTVPIDYTGLVQNGTSLGSDGFSNCLVKSIGLQGSSNINTGIARDYFGNGASNCSITSCYVICGGNIDDGGGIAGPYNSGDISNCYAICGGEINYNDSLLGSAGGIAGRNNSGTISNCYAIIGGTIGGFGGGIAAPYNSGDIYNCYAIIGGIIQGGGIASTNNSGDIYNCYAIIGGDISGGGGIAGGPNSGTISNCYVIIGGDISGGGGIAYNNNSGNISNCYAIIGGEITSGGGIAGDSNLGTISYCYVNYNTKGGAGAYYFAQDLNNGTDNGRSNVPEWTSTGANYLTSSGWTNTDSTNNTPWVLSAFDTAIASSSTTYFSPGSILLNTYGQTFENGTVYSGTNGATFTYNATSNIAYSGISSGTTYTLGLYAYELLSNLTSITFTFTYDDAIQTAFNYSGESANNIVPYTYSVTNNVTLTYTTISTSVSFGAQTVSTTITDTNGNTYTFPITVTVDNGVTISFTGDITINTQSTNYFYIEYNDDTSTGGLTVEGNNHTITIDGITNYTGLIKFNNSYYSDYGQHVIQNVGILSTNNSTLAQYNGWICSAEDIPNVSVNKCYSTGSIQNQQSGGIFGRYMSATSSITNCYSTGNISGTGSGGICGIAGAGTVTNCYSTGIIQDENSGGIFGEEPVGSAVNCYTTGAISGTNAGGIFGLVNSFLVQNTATNCYCIGGTNIGTAATTTNCYAALETWSDTHAKTYLANVSNSSSSSVWTDIDLSNTSTPYLLTAFNEAIYSPNSATTKLSIYTSDAGAFNTSYAIISLNYAINDGTASIDSAGRLTFNESSSGTYVAKVLSYDTDSASNYISYNISNFTLTATFSGNVPCFLQGTKIKVSQEEERFVEELTDGDTIMTHDGRVVAISKINKFTIQSGENTNPFIIPKGYSGKNKRECTEDLFLSPEHGILYDDKQIFQVKQMGFQQKTVEADEEIVYYHITLPNFFTDHLVANGVVCEAYGGNLLLQSNSRHVLGFHVQLIEKLYNAKTGARRILTTKEYNALVDTIVTQKNQVKKYGLVMRK